jgi:predicted GIY-YIG superfamily endonuclease
MFVVYILQGSSGRHYIGMTNNLERRLIEHRSGHTHTTRRLGGDLKLVASRGYSTRADAMRVERLLKAWKNPGKAIEFLNRAG